MAAEKLTRSRFIQICVLFVMLVTAFFWRTNTYNSEDKQQNQTVICTNLNNSCDITYKKGHLSFSIKSIANNNNVIQLHIEKSEFTPILQIEINNDSSQQKQYNLIEIPRKWQSTIPILNVKEKGAILDIIITRDFKVFHTKVIIKPEL
ncbi:MAG: hypothetical protein JKY55_01200 [Aliivibrio sp.]|uniref:hypothetical protein n=1 Tax=Aliivibrio sp. TaxID=1872443 RepID=UPI001A50193D|nr:hypothetical protein [Aliivibrio sp.]